ncbi:hypothetical protein [Solimicrobium silvestre]|uniref:hypothetical protein n=1 Tax=Solimicrobium silvestre TaxID=2099400 RepID=UPI001056FE0E|nr:hypothetical protein [Solimicrobium silvestre]
MRSNLGQGLRVQVPVSGATEDVLVPNCIKAKIESLDGELIDIPRVEIVIPNQVNQVIYINFSTRKLMQEPAIKFTVALTCGASLQRTYALLLDYSESPSAAPLTLPSVETPVTQITAITNTDRSATKSVLPKQPKKNHPAPPVIVDTVKKLEAERKVEPTQAKKEPVKASKRNGGTGKNVLKVTNEEALSDFDLKMSQTITEQTPASADQQRSQENRLAQARFAALLRGEDPLSAAQTATNLEQQKNKSLSAEVERLKQQNKLKEKTEQSTPSWMIWLASVATLLFLALIGMLIVTVRQSRQNKDKTWWDPTAEQKKNVVEIVDSLQSSAEKGNLDPSSISESQENSVIAANPYDEPIIYPHNKVEPSPKYKRMGLPALEDTNSSTFNFFTHRGQSIHIEEISDITQEAEFWMSVNDPNRAIEILEPQSFDENQTTPVAWLYLLDLYRMVADEEKYSELRLRFKRKFNAYIPNFHENIDPDSLRNFEDFPHLTANCCALWNTDEILPYLESLLVDDREGERIGFDLPVYRDILMLISISAEFHRAKKQPSTAIAPKDTIKPAEKAASEDAETNDYSDSLNFDLLDFKLDDKDKK